MKADQPIAVYRELREQPVWRLLASRHGPIVIGLLQTHLYDAEHRLPSSILGERIARDLDELRARGEDLPQTAQAYIAEWLREGYLERRYPPGAAEEEYELSSSAAGAIRFVEGLAAPRSAATESRLALVIQQLVKLAEETDANPQTRVARLIAERDRLDAEIERIRAGRAESLPEEKALERIREITTLADALAGDFRRVRDEFERLNRHLRERLLDEQAGRGDILERLFAGVDVIAESDAGRTFSSFWRLLTDPIQTAALDEALDQVLAREFAARLEPRERRFLLALTRTLLAQGGMVHDVMQQFATSLKNFVQSREYTEQRRISQLLKEAQRAALALKEAVPATAGLDDPLTLTGSRLTSLSQWTLFDPSLEMPPAAMRDAEVPEIGLDSVAQLVAQSEIDFRTLKIHIRAVLEEQSPASIAEIMEQYPAAQGLGSVVGYLALGSRHGVSGGGVEHVEWAGSDDRVRRAKIPIIYFFRERIHELA